MSEEVNPLLITKLRKLISNLEALRLLVPVQSSLEKGMLDSWVADSRSLDGVDRGSFSNIYKGKLYLINPKQKKLPENTIIVDVAIKEPVMVVSDKQTSEVKFDSYSI